MSSFVLGGSYFKWCFQITQQDSTTRSAFYIQGVQTWTQFGPIHRQGGLFLHRYDLHFPHLFYQCLSNVNVGENTKPRANQKPCRKSLWTKCATKSGHKVKLRKSWLCLRILTNIMSSTEVTSMSAKIEEFKASYQCVF